MDFPTYMGKIASLEEEFLSLMSLATNAKDQLTYIDKLFIVLTFNVLRSYLVSDKDSWKFFCTIIG